MKQWIVDTEDMMCYYCGGYMDDDCIENDFSELYVYHHADLICKSCLEYELLSEQEDKNSGVESIWFNDSDPIVPDYSDFDIYLPGIGIVSFGVPK